MTESIANYEEVSVYGLDASDQESLLSEHVECVFTWSTKDGWPVGVVMSYLWKDGRFWLTAGAHRHRISAVRRDPRVCITITSAGSRFGMGRSIAVKGRCSVHEDRETKDWFYPAFSAHLHREPKAANDFAEFLDSPLRVVLEVVPEKWITYDGVKMFMDAAGKLDPSRKTPKQSSDTERLAREIERRGLG